MANTLADEIIAIIKSEANNNPAPEKCTIKKVYDDNKHVDVEMPNGIIKYIDALGTNIREGMEAVIIFFDESREDYVVITDSEAINPCDFKVLNEELIFDFCGEVKGGSGGGGSGDVDIATSWNSPTSDERVPSEKLAKDTLDTKAPLAHSHTKSDITNFAHTHIKNEITDFQHTHNISDVNNLSTTLSGKQDTLVSGTNIKTINNNSLLGSGNINIQGGGGSVIGTGSFSIDENGHLIVELPDAVDNPYYINNNGHLIYDTSNTHNNGE